MAGLADLVIGVSGNIGVGKTTFTHALEREPFKSRLLEVLNNNPLAKREITVLEEDFDLKILDAFYSDAQRFALAAQIYFFNARLTRESIVSMTPGIVIVDRPIEEDYHVFGKAQRILNNMSEAEFSVYARNFELMTNGIAPPDVFVYLKADVPELQNRIKKRGRKEEQGLVKDPSYLETLETLYAHFFREQNSSPVIEIDANNVKLGKNGEIDEIFISQALEQIIYEVQKQKVGIKLTPHLGPWLSYNPTEAVIKSINTENELQGYLQENNKLLTVAGNIGLGKTAFARILANGLRIKGCYELDSESDEIGDQLLSNFLRDKPKHCYELQKHLLKKRLTQRKSNLSNVISMIEDRTPEEDPAVFHSLFVQQGLLTKREYDELQVEARRVYRDAPKSDLMIVLQGKPELSWQRILQRQRPEELEGGWSLNKDLRPLAKLYQEFPEVVKEYSLHQGPVLIIDVDRVDITQRAHQGFVYEQILQSLKQP
ncbi:deoxynucleoside kinase [Candidatus Woesearchaeota archaeon]|jgi:deoxyadenosine/deoxycytidine kinase|nr:deoxynucleoside kinase [Candidatus Woesearchaeota archaeon]